MPNILDPLTQAGAAVSGLLSVVPALSGYQWQAWDSDAKLTQPRAYVNVRMGTAWTNAAAESSFVISVIFEGKPKTGTPATAIATALAMVRRVDIATMLNALITDGSLSFNPNTVAESLTLAQDIRGDLRVRTIEFTLYGTWNVSDV